jgi:hypothetical protein
MIRLPNWQSSLERFFLAHTTDRFVYGSWDCCLFVCSAIEAMTGIDPAASFRGNYRTQAEAMNAVRAYAGTASIRALARKVTAEFGMQPVPLPLVRRGDLVLFKRARGYSLGILSLNGIDVTALGAKGYFHVPLSAAQSGWRV